MSEGRQPEAKAQGLVLSFLSLWLLYIKQHKSQRAPELGSSEASDSGEGFVSPRLRDMSGLNAKFEKKNLRVDSPLGELERHCKVYCKIPVCRWGRGETRRWA